MNADPHNVTGKSPNGADARLVFWAPLNSREVPSAVRRRKAGQRLPGNEGQTGITAEKPVVVMATACLLLVEPVSQVTTSVKTHQNVRVSRCVAGVPTRYTGEERSPCK